MVRCYGAYTGKGGWAGKVICRRVKYLGQRLPTKAHRRKAIFCTKTMSPGKPFESLGLATRSGVAWVDLSVGWLSQASLCPIHTC